MKSARPASDRVPGFGALKKRKTTSVCFEIELPDGIGILFRASFIGRTTLDVHDEEIEFSQVKSPRHFLCGIEYLLCASHPDRDPRPTVLHVSRKGLSFVLGCVAQRVNVTVKRVINDRET